MISNYPLYGETNRMKVRPSEINDYLQWVSFFEDSESVKYFPNPDNLGAQELSKKWVNSHIENYKLGVFGQLTFIEKSSNEILGSAGFLMCEIGGEIEIQTGVAILPKYQKKKYAIEALEYLNSIANDYNIDSLISIVHKDNIASQRLTEKAGKKLEKEIIYENCPAYLYRKII